MKATDTIQIAEGVQLPVIGFGVYASDPELCVASCKTALEAGYRQIDSAGYYANEHLVGQAIKQAGISRSDVFITTKIIAPPSSMDAEECYEQLVEGVNKFGLDYVDLFLIHTPSSGPQGRKLLWQALERLQQAKKTRAIGVSNYGHEHLKQMNEYAKIKPAVNQIELHPWCQSREHVKYCEENGIVLQAFCPLVRAQKNDHPLVKELASKYEKDAGQILIRWSLQKGYVPLPKSDTPSRIKSNIDVFGFDISKEDMDKLDALDEGSKGAIAPYNLNCA